MDFKCDLDQCDVKDKEGLKEYRKCLSRWNKWLFEPNVGIWDQVHNMMIHDSFFRIINELRGKQNEQIGFNWMFLHVFDYCFISSQLSTIRRLACDGSTDSISIRRLMCDMDQNICYFTRENFVSYDGLPFDDPYHDVASRRHEQFDKLIGSQKDKRKRDDCLPEGFFSKTIRNIGVKFSIQLGKMTNKHIAHTADITQHKETRSANHILVSLEELSNCHKEICQITNFITYTLLNMEVDLIPSSVRSPFENFEKPWASPHDLPELNKLWKDREEEIHEWGSDTSKAHSKLESDQQDPSSALCRA